MNSVYEIGAVSPQNFAVRASRYKIHIGNRTETVSPQNFAVRASRYLIYRTRASEFTEARGREPPAKRQIAIVCEKQKASRDRGCGVGGIRTMRKAFARSAAGAFARICVDGTHGVVPVRSRA